MANLLQSSQTTATTAPGFYTNYLANLAQAGQAAQQQAQYVGAQPLQQQAFQQAAGGFGTGQPAFAQGEQFLGQAAGQNIAGAAAPYIQAATSVNPLCVMTPYAQGAIMSGGLAQAAPYLGAAAACSPASLAASYMNPFISSAVQQMSDIGQRNIQQNLAPQATAAAVGSGQFGSQRGAQVLGQVEAQAEQCLNQNIANMLSQGYGQALCAAGKRQSLLATLGQTAGTLGQQQASLYGCLAKTASAAQQAQNLAQLQAAQTSACAAAKQASALQSSGTGLGTLGTQAAQARLGCLNALATLGGQQQTIAQNQQTFPLTTLGSLAGLLQGYQFPMSSTQTMCMSPFSALGAAGSGLAGLFQQPIAGYNPQTGQPILGSSPWSNISGLIKRAFCSPSSSPVCTGGVDLGGPPSGSDSSSSSPAPEPAPAPAPEPVAASQCCVAIGASGGLVYKGIIGCASTKHRGGLA
jgi:hypothetical protein